MSEFFIQPTSTEVDRATDAAELAERNPGFAARFDAIKELREIDDGSLHRGNEFRRVASLIGPIEDLLRVTYPEFMGDKKKFYAWLDEHPEYCTYDRRKAKLSNQLTFVDGKAVT